MSSPDRAVSRAWVVRPVRAADAAALRALVVESDGAIEGIDRSTDNVEAAIANSERSLRGETAPAQQGCLLLLEDLDRHEIVGCVGLSCRIGLEQPFYDYRLGNIVHSSRQLGSYRCLDVLYLCNDLTGSGELHSLYVRRDRRREGAARLLLKSAMLFIATRPEAFGPRLVVELRGNADAAGRSPFWESLGRHFFRVDQRTAEELVAKGRKAFIAELMPKHPVYAALLPADAQQAIGGIHEECLPLTRLLEAEGLRYDSHVDIFDGGRVLEGRTRELAGVAAARRLTAKLADADGTPCWLAAGQGAAFRATTASGSSDGRNLSISPATAECLGVRDRDPLLLLPD